MSEVAGVIPRAIHQIFQHLDSIDSDYTVKCSFLELYNEETTDLLAVGAPRVPTLPPLPKRGGLPCRFCRSLVIAKQSSCCTVGLLCCFCTTHSCQPGIYKAP